MFGGRVRRHVEQKANSREGGETRAQETQDLQTGYGETQNTCEETQPASPNTETRRDVVSVINYNHSIFSLQTCV